MFNRKNIANIQFKPMTPAKPMAPVNNYAKSIKPMQPMNSFAKPMTPISGTKSSANVMKSFKPVNVNKIPVKSSNTFNKKSLSSFRGK